MFPRPVHFIPPLHFCFPLLSLAPSNLQSHFYATERIPGVLTVAQIKQKVPRWPRLERVCPSEDSLATACSQLKLAVHPHDEDTFFYSISTDCGLFGVRLICVPALNKEQIMRRPPKPTPFTCLDQNPYILTIVTKSSNQVHTPPTLGLPSTLQHVVHRKIHDGRPPQPGHAYSATWESILVNTRWTRRYEFDISEAQRSERTTRRPPYDVDATKTVNKDGGLLAIGVTHAQRRRGHRQREGQMILTRGKAGDTETPGPSRAYKGQGDVKKKQMSNTQILALRGREVLSFAPNRPPLSAIKLLFTPCGRGYCVKPGRIGAARTAGDDGSYSEQGRSCSFYPEIF
ncbi:hypothetical protein B0H14DRAFT_2627960 [Mycena olivaceomarginata]|nr:hypothetical protein B0H14DRAFT_2627960 [Mycena olivaceomarginata]